MDRTDPPHLRAVGGEAAAAASISSAPGAHDGITTPSRRGGSRFLTDVLVEMEFVSRERVDQAIAAARTSAHTPERVLVESGALNEEGLSRAIAERYGLDHLDLTTFKVDVGAANLIGSSAAKRYDALPVSFLDERTLLVAMADPANVLGVDDSALMTGMEVRPAVASREDISAPVTRLTRLDDVVQAAASDVAEQEGEAGEVIDLQESAEDAPVIKLLNSIIAQAVEEGASDIHLEPDGRELRVCFRVDGVLASTATVPRRDGRRHRLPGQDHG